MTNKYANTKHASHIRLEVQVHLACEINYLPSILGNLKAICFVYKRKLIIRL